MRDVLADLPSEFVDAPSVASTLPPIKRTWENALLSPSSTGGSELERMAVLAAGPFHVLNTEEFRSNLNAFAEVCQRHGVESRIYFARKANKSECWIPAVVQEGHCVDVASGAELVGALGAGISATDMVVTGAEKAEPLLQLAIRHQVLIAVDSPNELFRINSLANSLGTKEVPVLLRLLPEEQPESRFGSPTDQWDRALKELREQMTMKIDCRGVAFHLNGYSASQRTRQAHFALDYLECLRNLGWSAKVLDIGGGFSVQYCGAEQWKTFESEVLSSDGVQDYFHSGRGPKGTYPYGGQNQNGPEMLDAVLSAVDLDGCESAVVSLASRLRSGGFELALEPGRSLLDGCGVSVFPIQGVKRRDGYFMVTVAGLSMSVSEQWKGSEFLPDMSLWSSPSGRSGSTDIAGLRYVEEDSPSVCGVCVGGSSCMEYDMLTWRKVRTEKVPRVGDLLVYHNTAGYQMDKNESEFHQLRLPMRFVWEGEGKFPKIDRPSYQELS